MATDERATTHSPATTESGLEPNIAGAVAYLFGFVTGVAMLLIDGDNEFVRFHAIQSIAFNVVVVAVYVVLTFATIFLSFLPVVGDLFSFLFSLFYPLVGLVMFCAWAFLLYKAYEGERFELPVIGSIARSK